MDQPRSLAADALGLIRGPVATQALVRALRDSTTRRLDPVLEQAEYVVANRIAENLDHSSDADAVDALLDALRTYPYPGCVKALSRTRERRAIPLLAERLGDDVTRDAAVEGLRRFDPELTQRVLVQTVADRRLDNGVERSDRVWGRAAAVLLLGELGVADVELARALDDPQAEVREAAARALSVRGAVDTRAIDVLVDALGGEDGCAPRRPVKRSRPSRKRPFHGFWRRLYGAVKT
ncbi:MAG TPA: HEAT repeat domain-containing protein [Polyangiaceae bacterium]|nr:HEAT repeat domain-containing protein [Polyangiaceae bacterium]